VKRLLFGGSFDPVHAGHVAVARAAAAALGADRVSLVPVADAPHKRGAAAASATDRLEMCRRAVAGDPLFDVLDVEVRRGGVSYTIDTVRDLLASSCRGDQLMLLLGQDSLVDLPNWRDARALAGLAPVAVVPRPGAAAPDWDELARALGPDVAAGIRDRFLRVPPVDVSSSEIRRRVAEGRSIRCRVPDAVADYIEERGLYVPTTPAPGR
jgi:nicotinate-nucleotide adenylyltransferase